MSNQQLEQDRPGPAWQWREKPWRLVIIAAVIVMVGFLAPQTFLLATRNEAASHAHRPLLTSALIRQHSEPLLPGSSVSFTDRRTASQIDRALMRQVHLHLFSGSVLIAHAGHVILARGYSLANEDSSLPNTPNTRFYLGSLTKAFTAMAILILQERGKLRVQDHLCTYIEDCPSPWQAISIQQVLTHTSGIPQIDDAQLSGTSPAAWISGFDTAPLEFAPGSEFDYCSVCYQILAYVVQRVSGQPYSQFVQQTILGPLGMKNTGFDANAYYAQPANAQGYESWQVRAPLIGYEIDPRWSFLFGSGLLYSSVNDLYRWDQALYTQRLVSQRTLTQALTPYANATEFPGSAYGYGWYIAQSPVPGHQLIWHNGAIDGFSNYIGRYIDDNVTVIILSNTSSLDVIALAHSIARIIFGPAASRG